MINVGLAICDVTADEYTLARVVGDKYNSASLEKLEFDAVELQIEEWHKHNIFLRNGKIPALFRRNGLMEGNGLLGRTLSELYRKEFKSFHCPIAPGNISSPDKKVREQVIAITKEAMQAAKFFGAHIFVLHPSKYEWEYWEKFEGNCRNYMQLREESEQRFLDSLAELSKFYANEGFNFQVGIENLEFNQFPSTSKEVWRLLDRSNEVWKIDNPDKMGVILDIQHLKHSKAMIEDHLDKSKPLRYMVSQSQLKELEDYAHTPIVRDYVDNPSGNLPIINEIFRNHLDDIILVHLAGNNSRHATHDPISYDIGTYEYTKEHYDRGMLNMRQVLDVIHCSGYNGAIILELRSSKELFDEKFEEAVTTLENVRKYLKQLDKASKK